MVRFDGYTATTREAKPEQLVGLFNPINGGLTMREGKGFHQFAHRLSISDGCGEVGAVQWGGRHGDRAMIEVKGERTPEVVERLRSLCPHRVTRMDSCADFDAPGAWNRLLRAVLATKRKHRLYGERRGDWDQPEKGRTMYLGSVQSVTRLRLYEKGKQPEYAHLGRSNWVRAETQVRPAKEAKDAYSQVSPLDCWGSSSWSRELAGRILADHVEPHPAGTTYRLTERDRALAWMCKQYGPHLVSLAADCGGWDAMGLTLGEMVREQGQ